MKKYLLILMSFVLVGCKTIYVPFETVRTEYKDKFTRDSIHTVDSIIRYEKGDTVFQDRIRYVYKDKLRVDSVIIKDSIPYPVEVIKEKIVRKLTQWQIVQIWLGRGLLIVLVLFLIFRFVF